MFEFCQTLWAQDPAASAEVKQSQRLHLYYSEMSYACAACQR